MPPTLLLDSLVLADDGCPIRGPDLCQKCTNITSHGTNGVLTLSQKLHEEQYTTPSPHFSSWAVNFYYAFVESTKRVTPTEFGDRSTGSQVLRIIRLLNRSGRHPFHQPPWPGWLEARCRNSHTSRVWDRILFNRAPRIPEVHTYGKRTIKSNPVQPSFAITIYHIQQTTMKLQLSTIALGALATASSILPHDAATITGDISKISTGIQDLNTAITTFDGSSLSAALAIQTKADALDKTIQTSASDAQASAALADTDSAKVYSAVAGLQQSIYDVLDNLVAKKAAFAKALPNNGAIALVKTDLNNLKRDTDYFGGNLTVKAQLLCNARTVAPVAAQPGPDIREQFVAGAGSAQAVARGDRTNSVEVVVKGSEQREERRSVCDERVDLGGERGGVGEVLGAQDGVAAGAGVDGERVEAGEEGERRRGVGGGEVVEDAEGPAVGEEDLVGGAGDAGVEGGEVGAGLAGGVDEGGELEGEELARGERRVLDDGAEVAH
ncbi:hypothetical protein FH972_025169 [Carpinus fangiana]|uniref:Uncharacterized protein n=1 Tax=Carpinus fangiana TaxID=176857 RepID=A0A5N6L0K9_9ROSI|nr:hypothetical protein FH972_025169 [Carpinus fangiana]